MRILYAVLLLILSNCAGLPRLPLAPDVYPCLIDIPRSQLICSNQKGEIKKMGLSDADLYLALSPEDYRKVADYIHLLKTQILNQSTR